MANRTVGQSPEQIARTNRQRLAAEEGAKAMEEAAREAVAIRKNMERLKGLRLAREASEISQQIADGDCAPKAKPKKRSRASEKVA